MQIEYSPLKAWPIGITGEELLFSKSDTPGLTNRKSRLLIARAIKLSFATGLPENFCLLWQRQKDCGANH